MNTELIKVKICGLTRIADARLAIELGAWALGFIFYSKSPRYIEPKKVKEIILLNQTSRVKWVGVFVNPTLDEVSRAIQISGINMIQLHGHESDEFCKEIKKAHPHLKIIKAFRILENQVDSNLPVNYDYQLFDSMTDQDWGGTGKTLEWNKINPQINIPLILAGGLSAGNIKQAILETNPFAVDVSSSLEDFPGIKSEFKLRCFFEAIR